MARVLTEDYGRYRAGQIFRYSPKEWERWFGPGYQKFTKPLDGEERPIEEDADDRILGRPGRRKRKPSRKW